MHTTHTTVTLTFGTDTAGRPTMMTPPGNGQGGLVSYGRVFRTHLEVMLALQVNMRLLQTGGYMLPGGTVTVWFPNMLASKTSEWTNRLLENDTIIEEREPNVAKNRNIGNQIPWPNAYRITFAKVANREYRYIGVFNEDKTASHPGVHVHKLVPNLASIAVNTTVTTI